MFTFDLSRLGQQVKKYRLTANVTQSEMARRSGLSLKSYITFEATGRTSTRTLNNILISLGKPNELAKLLSEDPVPVPSSVAEFLKKKPERQRASRKGDRR